MVATLTTSPIHRLIAAGREAWRPAPRPVRSEWCVENIRIPSETGAQPGPFDIDHNHAYVRGILDAVDDPEIHKVTWIAAAQIGKTEATRAVCLSQGEVDRAPMMFAGPDQIYVREQRELIYNMAEKSPALAGRVPPERLRNDRHIDLEKCLIYLAWSGSTQRLSGRSCKVVVCSEVDRWQNDPRLAEERTKAFPDNSTIFFEGTPIGVSPWLSELYKEGDRRTFRVPCPHCGHYQELRFFVHREGPYKGCGGVAGLKDKRNNWKTSEQARVGAYYLCEKGCRIDEEDRRAMVRRGVWARQGETVRPDGKIVGKPKYPGRHATFHSSSLYAMSFGDVAECYLNRRNSQAGLQRFWNDWLGLPFIPRGTTPRWKELGRRLAGDYPRGSAPRGAYFIVATGDVQFNGIWWLARAFGHLKTSWLVDFGFFKKDLVGDPEDEYREERLASDFEKVGSLLDRRWPLLAENPRGLSALAVRILGIDRGGRPTDTDAFVRSHPGSRVVGVFGDPHIVPGTLYRPMKTKRDPTTGKVEAFQYDDPRIWGIDTAAYKSEIADRWAADRTQPGVFWLPSDILETDGGEDYLRQITAESRTLETVNGRKCVRWTLTNKGAANHLGDDEVYASCLADMITGDEWDSTKWPSDPPRKPPKPSEDAGPDGTAEDFSAR